MTKEFVCKIDGRTFSTKEEAVEYLSKYYIKKIDKQKDLMEIKRVLEDRFPNFIVEVSKNGSILEEVRVDYDTNRFTSSKTCYCKLTGTEIKGEIVFAISGDYEDEFNEELNVFRSVEKAIDILEKLIEGINTFKNKLLTFAKKYEEDATDVIIHQIEHYDYEYDHQFKVDFDIVSKSGVKKTYTNFYIDRYELEEDKMEETMTKHLSWLSGRYVTVVEGEAKEVQSNDYYNTTHFEIDGVEINHLAQRAKKMRVTIIE